MLEHEPGDLTAIVEAGCGSPSCRRARAARAAARARPAGRPDARRLPAERPLGPAAPPLRRDARPRDRRHGRARRRDDRELGRQGRQERRRLRPRQALLAARAGGSALVARARAAAAPAARRGARPSSSSRRSARVWRELQRSQLVPSAVDFLPPGRLHVLFEGSRARGRGAGSRALRGERADPGRVWGESCRRQQPRPARWAPFDWQDVPAGAPGPARRLRRRAPPSGLVAARRARRAHSTRRRCLSDGPELIADCVHCGFCLPTCPTYELWHEEMDSPRGRIWLMQATLDGTVELDRHRRRALRPLPRLHGLPDLVPLGRPVRPADRADARARSSRSCRARSASGCCARSLFAVFPHRRRLRVALALRRAAGARAVRAAEGARAAVVERRLAAARHLPGRRSPRVGAAHRLRPERPLRRGQPRHGARARRLRLRRPRARTQGCCGALHAPRRAAASRASSARARARPAFAAAVRHDRHQRRGLRLAPEGRTASSCRVVDISELLARGHARRAAIRSSSGRLPGLLPPRATPSGSRASRARCCDSIPGLERARARRAGALLRQRRHLQPRPAARPRASSATARPRTCSRPAPTSTRAPTPAACSRSAPRCAAPASPLPAFHPVELLDASIRGVDPDRLLEEARR